MIKANEHGVPVWKVQLVRDGTISAKRQGITTSDQAAAMVMPYLAGADREHVVILLLDARHQLIGIHTVSIGTVSASLVHPREVFKPAILANASAVILAHNHPSGDLDASDHDVEMTRRLIAAGDLLGIPLLDHLIVCDDTARSLRGGHAVDWTGQTRWNVA